MPKQNQVLAIEKQQKTKTHQIVSQIHHALQRKELLTGLSRNYKPVDEDGERFPDEEKRLQLRSPEAIREVRKVWEQLWDLTAQKDYANTEAKADIVVNGQIFLTDVPATYLLWLEKQLADLHTFVSKLPTLPSAEQWEWDDGQNCYRTKPVQTVKTKKIPRAFVKAEATKEHPAQVDTVHEDKVQGYWTAVAYSGALPTKQVADMLERVEELQHAVKFAREQANCTEAPRQNVAAVLLRHVFAD